MTIVCLLGTTDDHIILTNDGPLLLLCEADKLNLHIA